MDEKIKFEKDAFVPYHYRLLTFVRNENRIERYKTTIREHSKVHGGQYWVRISQNIISNY